MAAFLDGCRFNPTAGGTTDWTYSTPVPGYQSPAAAHVVNGRIYKYRAESADLSQWELGEGAYNTGTGVLTRTTVLFNSSGTTSVINFSSVPQIAIVALKEDLIAIEEANNFTDTQKTQARSNVYAAPFDALAYNGMQINGSMDVDQEHAGNAVAAAVGYVIDGWWVEKVGTMAMTVQQVADAPAGLTNSIKVTVGTAEASLGSGDYAIVKQRIEGYRTARLSFGNGNAQPLSIGFWTKIHRPGTYGGAISNGGQSRNYIFTFTQNVADTWEFKTATIPGDVTGTWVGNTNGIGLDVRFCIAAGSGLVGTANTWSAINCMGPIGSTNGIAATTDVFQLSGLIVLPGIEFPSASRAPFIMRPYDQELMLCKRYFEKSYDIGTAVGSNVSNGSMFYPVPSATINNYQIYGVILHAVTKRITPTVSFWSIAGTAGATTRYDNSADIASSIQSINMSMLGFEARAPNNTFTTGPGGSPAVGFHWASDARL